MRPLQPASTIISFTYVSLPRKWYVGAGSLASSGASHAAVWPLRAHDTPATRTVVPPPLSSWQLDHTASFTERFQCCHSPSTSWAADQAKS